MDISAQVGNFLKEHSLILCSAESCTAGLIASILAQTPGSSAWLDAGFIVYSAAAKHQSLGVDLNTIETYNITSEQVACEMALGALNQASRSNIVVATTGVAGPGGGTPEIPVGTVCFAWAFKNSCDKIIVYSETKVFDGDRNIIRQAAAEYALMQIENYYQQMSTNG